MESCNMVIDNIDDVKNFFTNPENVASLNRFDFRKLYYDANNCSEDVDYHVDFIKDLTQVLYESKIYPLNYMSEVPPKFMYNSKYSKAIVLPKNIVGIREQAFDSCVNLALVEIQDGVKFIGQDAFQGCRSLSKIKLPNTINYIGERAFTNCTELEEFAFNGTVEQWLKIKKMDNWATYSGFTYVQCSDGVDSSEVF